MSPGINRLCAVAAVLAVGLLIAPCLAFDRLGTAGPIRSWGGKTCNGGYAAIKRGECDPPPVNATSFPERRSQERIERAKQLISLIRLEQAILELDAAIADDPANTAALLLRGRLRIPGKSGEAMNDVELALRINPADSNALATRAYLFFDKDEQVALQHVNKALEIDPANVDALWIRSLILARIGSLNEAEESLSSALTLEPDNPRNLLFRAQIRMRMGKASEAGNDATALLAVRPTRDAFQIRAIVRAMSGNYAGALDDLNAILAKPEDQPPMLPAGPGFVDLYVQRAIALTRTGKPAEAKRDLESIVRFGGVRAVLQMQVYLRSHGFPDVKLDGARSDQLDDALQACFINDACGRGISIPG
ncbi:tetratricopeptide (TPR) repeat protein [Bradyrhizobium sp. AZCC 2289]